MIRVQNIYHMLAYAFQVLREQGYRDIATEEFPNTAELCTAILIRGTNSQVKRGLGREYIDRTSALSTLRGKFEITDSVKRGLCCGDKWYAAMMSSRLTRP